MFRTVKLFLQKKKSQAVRWYTSFQEYSSLQRTVEDN